jgi:hypothetical protein
MLAIVFVKWMIDNWIQSDLFIIHIMWLQPQTRLVALFWARVTVSFNNGTQSILFRVFYILIRKHGPVKVS